MKLVTSAEMLALDRYAMDHYGIPGMVLMENAGLGTVMMMERLLGNFQDTFVPIFIGPGNNGGDGLVIGRHLHQRGCHPFFFFLISPDSLKGDAATNFNIVKKLKLPYHIVDNPARVETIPILFKQMESRGMPCIAVVDAIFGIGLARDVEGHFADAINLINRKEFAPRAPVISVDTPSGMDVNTGKVLGVCVRADYTATYCCPKPGHFIHGSAAWTGQLEIIDIGIPPEAVRQAGIKTELMTQDTFKAISRVLNRKKASHKGTHGHLLVLAGSTGKTGAAVLAARGALRSGAGLVSLCIPSDLNTIIESSVVEAMTIPLEQSPTCLSIADLDRIMAATMGKQAVVLGPGIGLSPKTVDLVRELYRSVELPMVLDADALNILAASKGNLLPPAGPRIFTPHPGELARLLDKSTEDIQCNRLEAAMHGCELFNSSEFPMVLVLKGAGTVVASDDRTLVINTSGNPGMAAAGMGDVLAGMIGAYICQGMSPRSAAMVGTYLHGLAADLLNEKCGMGFTASEVADLVPLALKNSTSRI